MDVRRVVIANDEHGKSVAASDDIVEPTRVRLLPGSEFHTIWAGDEPPTLPVDGTPPPYDNYFPPPGGFRFNVFTIGPASEAELARDVDIATGLAELGEKLPGMIEHAEPTNPGMHTTKTIDVGYVISGETWLELDGGAHVLLRAGDTYVQNGTRHAWRNESTSRCVIVVALIGAH